MWEYRLEFVLFNFDFPFKSIQTSSIHKFCPRKSYTEQEPSIQMNHISCSLTSYLFVTPKNFHESLIVASNNSLSRNTITASQILSASLTSFRVWEHHQEIKDSSYKRVIQEHVLRMAGKIRQLIYSVSIPSRRRFGENWKTLFVGVVCLVYCSLFWKLCIIIARWLCLITAIQKYIKIFTRDWNLCLGETYVQL